MKRIRIVGTVRGFFKHIMKDEPENIMFIGQNDTYEVAANHKNLIAKLLRTKIVGFWGMFKIINASNLDENSDYYLSFNRFLKTDKPYIIYLENPTALCNYSLTCIDSPFAPRKLKKYINDPKLKKIVCMSKACEETLEKVLKIKVPNEKITQIYPYVPNNNYVTCESIKSRSYEKTLKLLYISQGSRFISKGGLEIIEAMRILRKTIDVELTIITNIEQIDSKVMNAIDPNYVHLIEFNLPYEELEKIYASHHILLQPSSDDSFGLTVLEALKGGMTIISSDMYAFKEMVKNGQNGFLVPPSYYFFDKNNIPNPKVWNSREKTIYSGIVNNKLSEALAKRILLLYKNRKTLHNFSLNSLALSRQKFGKETILKKWENTLKEI